MDEKDLPSSSDESDADFVPKEEDNSDSGSEVSDYETSEGESSSNKSRKRKKRTKKVGKKAKTNINENKEEENNVVEEEKPQVDVDALWADFKKDVSNLEGKKAAESSQPNSAKETDTSIKNSTDVSPSKTQVNAKPKGTPNFPNSKKVGGLSKVLNQIGKKDKMSTLQKSQIDWNNFKKSEGIEEEIKMYNRGKDGYLDKQDFLQRTDLRQFEIEKDLRCARRKF